MLLAGERKEGLQAEAFRGENLLPVAIKLLMTPPPLSDWLWV